LQRPQSDTSTIVASFTDRSGARRERNVICTLPVACYAAVQSPAARVGYDMTEISRPSTSPCCRALAAAIALVSALAATATAAAEIAAGAAASAASSAAGQPTWLPSWWPLAVAAVGAVSPLAAWLGAKVYEQLSHSLAGRRTFAQETTKRVVELSTKHYWALANAAGTFGAVLQAHLRNLEMHLFVHYADEGGDGLEMGALGIQERSRQIAEESNRIAFPALVRLVHQFDLFQFRGSQTYLLPNAESSQAMRRLYNVLMSNLPEEAFLSDVRRAIEKHLTAEAKTASGDSPPGIGGTFLESGTHEDLSLANANRRLLDWLRYSLPSVSEAARAALAFEKVMQSELDAMTEPFFKSHRAARSGIDERTRLALERARMMGTSYLPMGGAGAGPGPSPTDRPAEREDATDEKTDSWKDRDEKPPAPPSPAPEDVAKPDPVLPAPGTAKDPMQHSANTAMRDGL
jgi:membrane protein implicated in regulation of membrane protease activity